MIKEVAGERIKEALALVNGVFSEFVAVDYSEQGKRTFGDYIKIKLEEVAADLNSGHKKMWAYYQNDSIIGVIATRNVSHIALMFVEKQHHRRGIAKQLFRVVIDDIKQNTDVTQITVNSSPYAEVVYEHLGFTKTGERQEKDGIIFIPMMCSL
jgi:predicted GNAT family N-acyltransferase